MLWYSGAWRLLRLFLLRLLYLETPVALPGLAVKFRILFLTYLLQSLYCGRRRQEMKRSALRREVIRLRLWKPSLLERILSLFI